MPSRMPKRKSPPLRAQERMETGRNLNAGDSIRAIATAIGRSPSTVPRKVRANRTPVGGHPALPSGGNRPRHASR